MAKQLILIMWDQLSVDLSSLKNFPNAPVTIIEFWEDFTHVKHHQKKIVFLLSAMRHFKKQLEKKWSVEYLRLDEHPENTSSEVILKSVIKKHDAKELIVTHPGEYRQLQFLNKVTQSLNIKLTLVEDERFFCGIAEGDGWYKKHKENPLMENFYHTMRRKTGYLMENNKPIGGKWNYDKENRQPPKKGMDIPHIPGFKSDALTQEVITFVKKTFKQNFGDIEPFWFGVTRRQALVALDRFVEIALADFGTYQDAMLEGEAFLYHSVLAQYLNVGLLSPLEICNKVEAYYKQNKISLACAEGFIRQVIGWREYVRMIYWSTMPAYVELNSLNYQNPLPNFYWTGQTEMRCLSHCIQNTKKHAYSHHIQRLMITGNFAMLIGVTPKYIHEWYLIVYIDAFEWVELPNTMGMATFADGGIVGTKPYVAGGNYINKMSNFCQNCAYNVKEKLGKNACPFNYLYWNFLIKHEPYLKNNMRLKMPYATLRKMSSEKKANIEDDAKRFIENIYKES
tara:strand:+ start:1763 stop:3292 length:1530 start_codon:yes stop_codon:yes gene_type:complete